MGQGNFQLCTTDMYYWAREAGYSHRFMNIDHTPVPHPPPRPSVSLLVPKFRPSMSSSFPLSVGGVPCTAPCAASFLLISNTAFRLSSSSTLQHNDNRGTSHTLTCDVHGHCSVRILQSVHIQYVHTNVCMYMHVSAYGCSTVQSRYTAVFQTNTPHSVLLLCLFL